MTINVQYQRAQKIWAENHSSILKTEVSHAVRREEEEKNPLRQNSDFR